MNRDFWENNAATWGRATQSHLIESRKITSPALVEQITALKPRSVLDLGCGEGWLASELQPKNIAYTGLDFSPSLIALARGSHPEATFAVCGYDDLIEEKWTSVTPFDLAVFNFSLFDEKVAPTLCAARRLVAPAGTILIQTLHPCFAFNPYADGWRTEDFKTFPLPFAGTMPWYGRTLGSWVSEVSQSGLQVRALVEPISPATRLPLSLILVLGRAA